MVGLPGDKLIRLILTLPVANVVFKGLSLLLFRSTLNRIILYFYVLYFPRLTLTRFLPRWLFQARTPPVRCLCT